MSDWVRIPLDELVDVIDPHPSHRAPDAVVQGIPFIGIGDIREDGSLIEGKGRIVSEKIFDEHIQRYQISDRTIGFGRVATIGKVISFQNPTTKFVVSPTMAVLEPKLGTNRDFILHALRSEDIQKQIDKLLTGSTRSSLGIELLRKLTILHPATAVAKKISKVLNSVSSQIDATQALIDKYTAIKQGMMADLFSRGIDPETKALRPTFEEAPELYHKTPLGMLPKGWDATPLRDVCDLQVGYAFKSSEFVSEGVSLLRGENVGYGKPSWKDRKCLSHPAAENYEEYLLGDSDIVIGMDRTFTKSGVKISKILDTDLPCLLVQRVGRFVPFGVVDGLIEHIVFQNHYLRGLMVAEQGMDIPHLSKDDILSPLVAIPECPKEAVLLTAVLDNVTRKLHAEQAFLEKMKLQKSGLMQDLLSGKVPVPA
ncbi:TPA: restriction endonuclease subunit S [Vibrio parahaemolyticus]